VPRRCTICDHSQRADIDTALLVGEAYRSIAQRIAISADAVWRHKSEHLPSSLTQAKEAETVSNADDLLAKVAAIETEAKRIAKKAEAAGDLRTAMSGVRELARLVELLAKLRGELNEKQTVNIVITPEWHQTRTIVLDALAAYPEARIAVAEALRRLTA
jgi:outer membrane murein-binding lipoprotein Lpp